MSAEAEGGGRDLLSLLQAQGGASGAGAGAGAASGTTADGGAGGGEGAGSSAPMGTGEGGGTDSFVLFAGSKQSGKSSLVTQFLNPSKEEVPKPTVALEYTYGRRSNSTTSAKDIAHIWELGGGALLSDLINVPITPHRLPTAVVALTVDLAKPETAVSSLMHWLTLVKARIADCVEKMKKLAPEALTALLEKSSESLHLHEHPDTALITPSPIPIVILCTKYDIFQDVESTKRRTLLQALRYIALTHGATLLCVSQKDKSLLNHFRNVMNHFVFGTEVKRVVQLNHAKALVVPAGADTLEGIGLPSGCSRSDVEVGSIQARVAKYKRPCDDMFPASSSSGDDEKGAGEDESARWVEGDVDTMRTQKMEEIERYKKEAERKLRLEAKAGSGEGGGGAGAGAGSAPAAPASRARSKKATA